MSDNVNLSDNTIDEIDRALADAARRKAEKANKQAPADSNNNKRTKLTDEERAARIAKMEEERKERRAAREAEREARRAEREQSRSPAHMKKVMRAAEKLAPLSQAAELLFNEATGALSRADLAALALHIQHFNRVRATERAAAVKIAEGTHVRIVGGDPRFIGREGTVEKAQRIRCYVTIEGLNKPLYLFTSDVEALESEPAQAVNG